MSTVPAPAAVG